MLLHEREAAFIYDRQARGGHTMRSFQVRHQGRLMRIDLYRKLMTR